MAFFLSRPYQSRPTPPCTPPWKPPAHPHRSPSFVPPLVPARVLATPCLLPPPWRLSSPQGPTPASQDASQEILRLLPILWAFPMCPTLHRTPTDALQPYTKSPILWHRPSPSLCTQDAWAQNTSEATRMGLPAPPHTSTFSSPDPEPPAGVPSCHKVPCCTLSFHTPVTPRSLRGSGTTVCATPRDPLSSWQPLRGGAEGLSGAVGRAHGDSLQSRLPCQLGPLSDPDARRGAAPAALTHCSLSAETPASQPQLLPLHGHAGWGGSSPDGRGTGTEGLPGLTPAGRSARSVQPNPTV